MSDFDVIQEIRPDQSSTRISQNVISYHYMSILLVTKSYSAHGVKLRRFDEMQNRTPQKYQRYHKGSIPIHMVGKHTAIAILSNEFNNLSRHVYDSVSVGILILGGDYFFSLLIICMSVGKSIYYTHPYIYIYIYPYIYIYACIYI